MAFTLLSNGKTLTKSNHISIFLVLFFVCEFLSKVCIHFDYEFYRYGAAIKVIFLVYYLVSRPLNARLLAGIALLSFIFLFSQIFTTNDMILSSKLSYNLIYLAKYFFIFFVSDHIIRQNYTLETIKKPIQIVFLLLRFNFLIILIGALFDIDLFSTYKSNRFGYNGLIQMNSHSSYIYIFASIYVIYQYVETKRLNVDLFVIIISSLMVGTKTIYLFYFLIGIYLFFYFKLYKDNRTYVILFLITVSAIIFNQNIYSFLFDKFKVLFVLMENEGFITAATSTRNQLLKDTMAMSEEFWSPINYFLGGSFFYVIRSEMGFFDLYFFWGIIGSLVYLKLYYDYVIKHYLSNAFLKYAILIICLVVFLAGNFFTNAVIAIYIVLFSQFFSLNTIPVRYS